jgi:Holliday junction resolvasome RuvABC endonuclease subunit
VFAGFDLGAKFGYAVLDNDGNRVVSGTWLLGKREPSSIDKLYTHLRLLSTKHNNIAIVGYEKVNFFGKGVKAAHAYGNYEGVLWLIAVLNKWELEYVTVQRIKKTATGFSNADKEEMEAAAMTRWARVPDDDNEADALFCAEYLRLKFFGSL